MMVSRVKAVKIFFLAAAGVLVGYLIFLMLMAGGGRSVAVAGNRDKSQELYRLKGTIYDRDLMPLTNATAQYYLLIDPRSFDREQAEYIAFLCDETADSLHQRLQRESVFILTSATRPRQVSGVYVFDGVYRYGDIAHHLIGYVNGDMMGITGLERSYDTILSYFGGQKTLNYVSDARSNPLVGLGITVEGDDGNYHNGLITTLDSRIQRSLEKGMDEHVSEGAAVVLDIDSGEIRAMVSRPDFDAEHVGKYLDSEAGELINRALRTQTVGSVFKVVVAAAALENKLDGYECQCEGSIVIGDREFSCPVEGGHGAMDIKSAFAQSCNVYFISVGQMLGTQKVMEMAQRMGFGESMEIASELYASGGMLPDVTGNSAKQLANISIGQGDVMASPLQIARLLALCGNGGYLVNPTCFQGYYVDGVVKSERWLAYRKPIIDEAIAERLKELCIATVKEGTGQKACPEGGSAGGKTSSAQTGLFREDGSEVLNAYFAGFFPAEQPRYAIAVFAQDAKSGGATCAPVFQQVCEDIMAWEKGLKND